MPGDTLLWTGRGLLAKFFCCRPGGTGWDRLVELMEHFCGPLFLVGSPRSGTKLLRSLLNRHSLISLCDPESHFIPYLFQKHGGDPARFSPDLDRLFADFDRTPFQIYSRTMGRRVMSRADFEALAGAPDWSAAFGVILRFYAEEGAAAEGIWGDKTPSYVLEMTLLKRIFPAARFLHIVRDPRDVALSAQRAWGHSPLRVAAKWARDMAAAQRSAPVLGADCLRVYYEDLLADPGRELRRISEFAGRPYEAGMTRLTVPAENLGAAKGKPYIDAGNAGKYRTALAPARQQRIEEIVFAALPGTPYRAEYARRHRPLPLALQGGLALGDGARSLVHKIRRKGLVNGIRISIGNRIQKGRSPS